MNTPAAAYSFPLDGRTVTIGRDPSCDVVVGGVGVSRKHAAIVCAADNLRLQDLESTYGTRLDGKEIANAQISSGSAIAVGMHLMQVYVEDDHVNLTILNPGGTSAEVLAGEDKSKNIRIGRGGDNDICLRHPMVSRYHAVCKYEDGGLVITDLGSANATYVNGKPVKSAALSEGDAIHIGPFRFFVKDSKFCRAADTADAGDAAQKTAKVSEIKIEARSLGLCLKGKKLLDGVDLTIEPGTFVALLGGSGAGKSLLSKVLSGQLQPTSGRLFLNGFPASKFGAVFKRGIGYVSQQILLRQELTVWETIYEQALIRLPIDSTESERFDRAREVLELMGLDRLRDRRVLHLSGGEARRLHVGVELLASPAIIILDEPLAGLDSGLIVKFMRLFRKICDRGHTLIHITHNLEEIDLYDNLIFIKSGRAQFCGKPADIRAHFGVSELSEIYDRSETLSNVGAAPPQSSPPPPKSAQKPPRPEFAFFGKPVQSTLLFLRQSAALVKRYSKVYVRDRRNMALLLAQTPVITLLLGFVYKSSILQFPASFYFCLAVTGIWVGGLDAVREVANELPLLRRETKCGLSKSAYITARLITAGWLSFVQALMFAVFAVIVFVNLDFSMELLAILFASIFAGNILGLAVSVCSGSVGRAISTLPVVLIPQIFFSGILVQFEQMSDLGRTVSRLTISRPIFGILRRVYLLDQPLAWFSEWTELFLLCGLLTVIFAGALAGRTKS